MKKHITLLIITMLCMSLSAQGTPGLRFTLINNGTAYEVSGGTATATTHIDIPPTHQGRPVTKIATRGFAGFTSMTSINIPSSVTTIGELAFEHCTGLTSITIPSSTTTMPWNSFTSTPNLENIHVQAGNRHFRSEGNSLIRNSDNTLIAGTKNSIIPSSVTRIGFGAFWGCTSLTSITIPSSVTRIDAYAFAHCTGLTSITIPSSVTMIGISPLKDTQNLENIHVQAGNRHYRSEGNSLIRNSDNTLIASTKNSIIPNSVTGIGVYAFWGTSLTSITIPSSVVRMEKHVFVRTTSLTIYAEAPSKPSGWHAEWNASNRPVVWGHVSSPVVPTPVVETPSPPPVVPTPVVETPSPPPVVPTPDVEVPPPPPPLPSQNVALANAIDRALANIPTRSRIGIGHVTTRDRTHRRRVTETIEDILLDHNMRVMDRSEQHVVMEEIGISELRANFSDVDFVLTFRQDEESIRIRILSVKNGELVGMATERF